MKISYSVVCFLPFFLITSLVYGVNNNVPALYIFGDSTVDTGNRIPPESNPYGIDLDASLPSRWTNGKAISDYLAFMLELPLVPPFNNSKLAQSSTTGINFAFGGAGILPETKLDAIVGNWTFDKQITYFNSTLTNHLNKTFSQPDQLLNHLSKSVFFISFGINDFFVNYIPPYNNHSTVQPRVFANRLLTALSERLTTLYRMGARKFLVNNIWPMGCMPMYHLSNLGICDETINNKVLPYATSLPSMLQSLALTLPGFDYSYSDNFEFVQELNITTQETGVTNITSMCWDDKKLEFCADRDLYVYFDDIHTSQAVNNIFVRSCFSETICYPKSISDLVRN